MDPWTVADPRALARLHWQKQPAQEQTPNMPPDKGLQGLSARESRLIVEWVQPVAAMRTAHRRSVGPRGAAVSLCLGK